MELRLAFFERFMQGFFGSLSACTFVRDGLFSRLETCGERGHSLRRRFQCLGLRLQAAEGERSLGGHSLALLLLAPQLLHLVGPG